VYEWSNDLVVRVQAYFDIDEARAAAERLAQQSSRVVSGENVD
jgi:hypothetical protein